MNHVSQYQKTLSFLHQNEAFRDDKDEPGPSGLSAAVQSSDSLEEVRTRVHALLDDAFSLISNSYSSIG